MRLGILPKRDIKGQSRFIVAYHDTDGRVRVSAHIWGQDEKQAREHWAWPKEGDVFGILCIPSLAETSEKCKRCGQPFKLGEHVLIGTRISPALEIVTIESNSMIRLRWPNDGDRIFDDCRVCDLVHERDYDPRAFQELRAIDAEADALSKRREQLAKQLGLG